MDKRFGKLSAASLVPDEEAAVVAALGRELIRRKLAIGRDLALLGWNVAACLEGAVRCLAVARHEVRKRVAHEREDEVIVWDDVASFPRRVARGVELLPHEVV